MEYKIKDRSGKVAKRRSEMRQNGRQLKVLLIERAAKAQASK